MAQRVLEHAPGPGGLHAQRHDASGAVIGSVKLEPMVSFTVRVRPGQTVADFTAAAPSLAAAMNAARLKVEPISPHWVRIVLFPKNVVPFPVRSDDEAA